MSQTSLARKIAFSLFIAVMAGSWDVWWHGAVGRESFLEPPHLFLYSAVGAAIIFGWLGFRRFHETRWRRIAIALSLIVLSAPIDDIWHRAFGVESLDSPFVIWSPPHLILIGALIFSFLSVLPVLLDDKQADARMFFGTMILGSVASLGMLLAGPLEPLGPFRLLGFAGAGFVILPCILSFLFATRLIGGYRPAVLTSLFIIVLMSFRFGERLAPGIVVPIHDHAPGWLSVFAFLGSALIIDFWRKQPVLAAISAAATCSILSYGVSNFFLLQEFRFGLSEAMFALASGLIGGLLARAVAVNVKIQSKK